MGLAECPPELKDLNYMNDQPSPHIPYLCSSAEGSDSHKGVAISFPFDVAEHVSVLARLVC